MPEPFHLPGKPHKPDSDRQIDIDKRYDVYCSDYGQLVGVHRNVLFKGIKYLFKEGSSYASSFNEFVELEQLNQQSIFVSRHHILYFCEHGAEISRERLPPE